MSKAKSFLIGVMALPSCRSAAGRPEAGQDLKSGATGSSSQQALGKEASSSSCSSRRAHTEPCIATSPAATIPYRRPPTPTPTSTTAPRLERPHRRYVRLITPVFAVLLALTLSPAWAADCTVDLIVAPGESCTYPGTTATFSVSASGRGQFGFISSGNRISIVNSSINGVIYTFVASKQGGTNNWLIEQVGEVAADSPDLVVGSPTVSNNSPVAGASFTLSATVRNRGSGASGSTTLRYYRSTDASISSSDTEVGTDAVSGLSASATSAESISLTAPSAGTYYYGACVEAVTDESDTGNNCSSSVTVTVSGSGPDFVVDTPLINGSSGTYVNPGRTFTLRVGVSNNGSSVSGSTTLRYYRSTDATITTSDTEVGTDQVGGSASGWLGWEDISLTAPSTPGRYYYGACVEAVTGESDTGNNCSSAAYLIIRPFPDLAVDAPRVSDNGPVAGASFTLGATVRNQGNGASRSATLRYYRSTDATITTSDTEVGIDAVDGLSASGSSAESISLTAPSAGTYYYGACVEMLPGAELNTGNNCSSSVQVTVSPPPPDLAVDAPTVSDNSPVAGASFTLRATVRNRGDGASGSTTLRYYRSTDATISSSDTEVGTDAVSGLSASATSAESISLTAPSAGTYYYGACVAAVAGESATGNNCSPPVRVTVPAPAPDLAVDAPSVTNSNPTTGASFTLRATVRNRGNGASGSTTLRYYRSTDASISSSDTEVGTDPVNGLSASATSAESISLTAPSAGTYYYGACVDAVTGESDTGNNCSSSVQVTVSPVPTTPDLAVDAPSVTNSNPTAGASFTLRATVRNRGDGASGSTTLRYYRSTDASISSSDTEVGTDAVSGLSASGTSAESISLTAPSAGTYYYGACVEAVTGESATGNNCSSSVQVTVSPVPTAPDLVVGSPTVTNSNPTTGASFTLRATVRNRGDGASGSTTLRYYRSTNATISTSDTEVGTDPVSGLSASGTSAESISLTAPSAGTYYYGACVAAVTGESDTGNNCSSSVTVTVSPVPTAPDLAVDAPSVSDNSPVAGGSFTLSATVRNRGDGASGSTTLRYYRSTDATISTSDTEVGTDQVGGLSASATSAESISLTAPSAGTYYYGACVDAVTGESATGNNCSSSVTVTVSPVPTTAPDLVVGSPTASDNSPVAGASFTLRATVRNRGSGTSGSTTLRYYRSTDASISSSDTEVGTDQVNGLSASGSSAESISLTAPSAGTYYYGACVDAVTGESDTGNNCSSSVTVTVSPVPTAPDLAVDAPSVSDNSPVAGGSFTLSATVRNRGDGASGSTTLRYYRSTDATISTSDTEVGTDAVGGLSASGTSAESISLTAPSAGTYYYGACVAAVTGESDTGNNCSSSVTVTVSPVPTTAPDLVVGAPTASDNSPVAGASFTLRATVRNRGSGASGSTTLRYYRSTNATISTSDTEVGTDQVNGLSASGSSAESISLTAPSAGTYYYGACVAAVTGESDTGNNCSSSVTVTVSPVPTAPDLAVDAPSVSDNSPVAGGSFTLSATVRNRGDGASGSTTLRYYRSTDASITTSDTEVGTDPVGGLSASATSAESISLTAPSAGTYYYGACVAAVTGESDTGNNCSSSVQVTVSPVPTTPDLVVGSPTASDNSPVAGASFTLRATVRNRGGAASGSTTLRYYRSTNATISSSDTEVGTDQVGGLSASGTSAESISLTAPSAGTYYYGACVAAVTGESDTGNNCSSSVQVTVSPVPTAPDLVATDAQNKIDLTWSAPSGNGGSAITAYDLRYIRSDAPDKADANWTVVEDVWSTGSGALTYELTGLSGGTQYDVQVRAVNGSGDGPWSATATGTPEPETQPTDFDGDGKTDLVDFFRFVDAYGGTDARFDLDGSGKVDFVDFFKFVDAFGS